MEKEIPNTRFSLLGILRGLMLCENLGDVHDEINYLHDFLGIKRPEGNFLEGWTDEDMLPFLKVMR